MRVSSIPTGSDVLIFSNNLVNNGNNTWIMKKNNSTVKIIQISLGKKIYLQNSTSIRKLSFIFFTIKAIRVSSK